MSGPLYMTDEEIQAKLMGWLSEDDKAFIEIIQNHYGRVMFRAGFLVCREYMARFAEAQDPSVAQSIRANWHGDLGENPGPPRPALKWDEVANGGEEGPWSPKEYSPNLDALLLAWKILNQWGIAPNETQS